jgi:hypothetical protein
MTKLEILEEELIALKEYRSEHRTEIAKQIAAKKSAIWRERNRQD